jgi:transposase-like protein
VHRLALDGIGGKSLCKKHGYQRKSRCKECAKKGTNKLGCSLCQKKVIKALRECYRENPPNVGGTPRTVLIDVPSSKATTPK